jgi:DNA uptake protein ComE-like DNA-binding protein
LTEDARRSASAERLEAALAASPPAADGRLDLNAATFEALRALGLSVNQAARFIGQRDERGGFRSMDDLDGLYGLPSDVLRSLYEHGAV